MEVAAGWVAFGDLKTVELKDPCPRCKYTGEVDTQPIVTADGTVRKLPTLCPDCKLYYELSIAKYGRVLGWKAAKSARSRRGPGWMPRDHQLFARYDWCCVYHEGSAEAALFRSKQIDALQLAAAASSVAAGAEGSLFASAADLARPLRVDPNLFGLVPDHVIPKSVQELLDDRWTPQHRDLMSREWIVAACGSCNGQRNLELENFQKLLYIFSRFVLPHRPGNEIARLHETFLFVEVLDAIERYRAEEGIAGPLRPLRLARKEDIDTG